MAHPPPDARTRELLARGEGKERPIVDTHIHFFQPSRPGGVPWPPPGSDLFRDVLPAEYEALARRSGILASGIVEASPLHEDTAWILGQIAGNDFFPFYVAQLELGSAGFEGQLEEIAADARVVGLRGFLWSPTLTLDDRQRAHLHALASRGMILELISRGGLNPKVVVDRLAAAVPALRIVIDHLGGARSERVDPVWEADMRRLAARPNLHVKLSSLFDMFNTTGDESKPWDAPKEVAAYRAHLEVLMSAFGEDRLIWGSNWPVCTLAGTLEEEIQILEEYLRPLGREARDKVMFRNAILFYRRLPPG
jgi:predicted TIM-barrel fold metal-dependent hydrolase